MNTMLPERNSTFEQKSHSMGTQIHAVLVSVFGTGVLLIGESGTGKSRCALELIEKGHQLVADDAVVLFGDEGVLMGRANSVVVGLLEIRGFGIVRVRSLFRGQVTKEESPVHICIELVPNCEPGQPRSGVHSVGGHSLPRFVLPVGQRRNLGLVVEKTVHRFNRQALPAGTLSVAG